LSVATETARSIAELNPAVFANRASGGGFVLYKHLVHIGARIARAATTPNARVIVNVPPRHYKSTLCSFWSPVWYLHNWPTKQVMLQTNTQKLGNLWGRRVRNEMRANRHIGTTLARDATAANLFYTPEGGSMSVFGLDAAATGFGADLLIIDDPHSKMEDLYKREAREKVHRWYDEVYSRLNGGASIFVLMQRMHPEDLCGYLMSQTDEPWDVVCLPAIAEENDPMGRPKGQALCRAVHTEEDYARIKRRGEEGWFARYQQRPVDRRSGLTYSQFGTANVNASVDLVPGLPLQMSIDFNIRPGMHAIIGQHNPIEDTFTAVYELYEEGLDLRGMMTKFAELIKTIGWNYSELQLFGDAAGNQRTMENASVGETYYSLVKAGLHRMGFVQELGRTPTTKRYRIRVPKANPRIVDSVMCVNDVLCDLDGKRRYLIHPRCEELIADFKGLRNGEDGVPDKSDQQRSHSADAERYRIHYLRPSLHRAAKKK